MSEQPEIVPVEQEASVKKEHIILLLLTVLFGILFDVLFYGKAMGISYPIFVAAYYAILLWYMRKDLTIRPDFGWLLTIPVIMLSLTYTLHTNFVFYVLNFMAIPVLLMVQTLLITKNNKYAWHDIGVIEDILYGFFVRTFGNIGKPFSILGKLLHPKGSQKKYDNLKKVLLGLIIAVPLLMIILSLLASADSIFEQYLGQIPDWFKDIKIGEFLFRGIMILSVCIVSFGYIWSLSERRKGSGSLTEGRTKWNLKVWDPVVVITILTTVNIIYVLFVFIQFSYLFGGLKAGLPAEFTFAEYARRGFFELVAVTLINFSILLFSLGFTRKKDKATDRTMSILNTLLVGCTLVILFSAHFRMSMYEEAYGYTYLRMFTHIFMVFLFILFLLAFYRIWNEKFTLVKPYIIASIAAFLIVNYMNVDVIIARNNVDRFYNDRKIDMVYLADLSYDAAPQIARLLDCGDSIVAQQANDLLYGKKLQLSEEKPWQSLNLSVTRAREFLAKLDLKPAESGEGR